MKIVSDHEAALRVYYTYPEIGNKEICMIYGPTPKSTLSVMKRKVRDLQAERGVPTIGYYTVNTKLAYEAWGIDVEAIEKNLLKLRKLGITNVREET